MSDISSISKQLVAKLNKENRLLDVGLKFSSFTETFKKIDYVYEILTENNYFPNVERRVGKNAEQSETFRRNGNDLLQEKKYMEAIDSYNRSIAFAKPNTKELSIIYSDRAMVYSILKLHNESLNDIELAKNSYNNHPEEFLLELEKRSGDSRKALEKAKPSVDDVQMKQLRDKIFKLSYEVNLKVPFIINGLTLKTNDPTLGRSITAKFDLKPGDVIAIEKPFAAILLPDNRYERCAYCLLENNYQLMPCPSCTSVMFCSEKCLKLGFEKFHKYECPIIDYLFTVFQRIHLIAIRVVIQAISFFKDIDRLIEFDKNANESKHNAFTTDYVNMRHGKDSDLLSDDGGVSAFAMAPEFYYPIHTLCTNSLNRSTDDMFHRAIPASIISKLLIEDTDLKEIIVTDKHKNFLKNLILRHLQIAPTNFHSLDALSEEDIKANSECDPQYGSGAYPFCSLINHSCAPNICRVSFGSTIYVFVIRPIPRGEHLLDNYGFHHCLSKKVDRQESLKLQYCFKCECIACERDYPLFHQLEAVTIPHIVALGDIHKMVAFDKKFVNENIEKYFEFLTKFSAHFYPCSQISDVEEAMKMCLKIISGNAPLKLTNTGNV